MIYYISGGQKSGKSRFAQELALKLSPQPVYLATARVWDQDFRERIQQHRSNRGNAWTNIEKDKDIDRLELDQQVVVLDCVTLWLTNIFHDHEYDSKQTLDKAYSELGRFLEKDLTIIVISNELGMGLHADSASGRQFTDIHGSINQYLGHQADKAVLMVSGLPLELK